MDKKNGSFPFDFPFPFEKWLGGNPLSDMSSLQNSGIQEYVQGIIKSVLPEQMKGVFGQQTASGIPGTVPEVFETHRSVIVRVKVPPGINPSQIRVVHNPYRLRIEGLDSDRTLKVTLPAVVHTQHTRSKIKDGILEVRLLKRIRQGPEREVYIEY